jgi:hypothetical protein
MEIKYYSQYIPVIDAFLKSSSTQTLNEPAILDRGKGTNGFYGYAEATHEHVGWPVKPNPTYFKQQIPKTSPQFLTVHFNLYETKGDNIYRTTIEELTKLIDFNALKAMLDK